MDQSLNVDRYLTQRVGIVRRLLDAQLPPEAAERWVAAWEEEAQRRGLDPGDAGWWGSAWEWIAQDCGGFGRTEEPTHESTTGPFAESAVRVERQVVALAEWLRHASKRSYRASDPDAPDHEWLRREMQRLCKAYEAAVGEAHGP